MITFYDQSGSSRRVNTKKKITTIKKRRFIPYRMEIQDLDEILARKRKGKLSDNRDTQYDDDGYDTDQYTQYSEASSIDNSSQYRNNNEEEEEDQQSFQPRTLREKMNAVQELLAKMEGNLDDIEDYEFSEDWMMTEVSHNCLFYFFFCFVFKIVIITILAIYNITHKNLYFQF